MAIWYDLPLELRDPILLFFFEQVMAEYTAFNVVHPIDPKYTAAIREPDAFNRWPRPPRCLVDFSNALRTCRDFHHAFTCRITINNYTAADLLQYTQYNRVRSLASYVYGELYRAPHAFVGIYVKAAGHFWKNGWVLEHVAAIRLLLLSMTFRSWLMLIPHLQEWLSRFARPTQSSCKIGYISQAFHCPESWRESKSVVWKKLTLWKGMLHVFGDEDPCLQMTSVQAVLPKTDGLELNDQNRRFCSPDPNINLIRDIVHSPPNTWWLLRVSRNRTGEGWSFFVNYEMKKIFSMPDAMYGLYWGDLSLPLSEWRRDDCQHPNDSGYAGNLDLNKTNEFRDDSDYYWESSESGAATDEEEYCSSEDDSEGDEN